MDDKTARDLVNQAWQSVIGVAPTLAERQAIQAVGRYEGSYGYGWHGITTRNWGAIQCGTHVHNDCVDGHCISWLDHKPSGSEFHACYRVYDSDYDGALALVQILHRMKVTDIMASGDSLAIATKMHQAGYYGGICPKGTLENSPECIKAVREVYGGKIYNNAHLIANACGESLAITPPQQSGKIVPVVGGGLVLILAVFGTCMILRKR